MSASPFTAHKPAEVITAQALRTLADEIEWGAVVLGQVNVTDEEHVDRSMERFPGTRLLPIVKDGEHQTITLNIYRPR